MPASQKIAFALEVEDGWPPVAVEHVWCERRDAAYIMENVPFFISGLASGDVFRAEPDPVNGCIFEFEVVQRSGHSVVWVLNNEGLDFSLPRKRLLDLGCRLEGFPQFNLFAIDVPANVAQSEIGAVIDALETAGFALAFPVWNHDVVA